LKEKEAEQIIEFEENIHVYGAREHNLRDIDVIISVG